MGHRGDENPDVHSSKSHGCKSVQTPLRFQFLFLIPLIPWSTLTLISVNSIYWQNLHCWRHLWTLCFPAPKYHPAGMGSTINSWSTASYKTSTLPCNFSTISTQTLTLANDDWKSCLCFSNINLFQSLTLGRCPCLPLYRKQQQQQHLSYWYNFLRNIGLSGYLVLLELALVGCQSGFNQEKGTIQSLE